MSLPTLLAVSSRWETDLATGLDGHPEVGVVRRCADLPDLMAAAGAGLARAAVLSSDLDGLDADVLRRLRRCGLGSLVLLADPTMPAAEFTLPLAQAGGARVLPAGSDALDVAEALLEGSGGEGVVLAPPGPMPPGVIDHAGAYPTLLPAVPQVEIDLRDSVLASGAPGCDGGLPSSAMSADPMGVRDAPQRPGGRGPMLVAVWGTAGAPGRTTVAITVAAELARLGASTLLVDADTYASAVSPALGLLEEGSGLASAVRAATAGRLDLPRLAALAPVLAPELRVLTGLPTPRRWHELRPAGLEVVWAVARELASWTIVDCAPSLDADEDLMYDTAAPRRNQATLSALEAADLVVVVGSADPIGLQRLVRSLQELAEVVPAAPVRVVVTKLRASAVGGSPQRRVSEALARFAPVDRPVLVPDDRPACDAALLAGRSLTEHAPDSPARVALAQLAQEWVAASVDATRGRRRAVAGSRRRRDAAGAR